MQEKMSYDFDDFVNYQLYVYAKSKNHKNNVIIMVVSSVVMLFAAIYAFWIQNYFMGITFIFVGLFLIISLKSAKRTNEKYFREAYRIIGMDATKSFHIEFYDDCAIEKNNITLSEYKMDYKDMFEIAEVLEAFYLRFNTGIAFILSKKYCENEEQTRKKLQNLANSLGIKYVDDSLWKWK
ncbi:MAG: hypothetical protein ACK5LP_10485 [Campylobacteraceae bacterium]